MREILFRGKRADNGEWVEGCVVKGSCTYILTAENIHYMNMSVMGHANIDVLPVIPTTVGQYTGLKDLSGKLIFEGDICRNTKTNEIVSVKWHGTMAGYVWNKRKENSHLFDFGELFRAYDKYEVIGNIHDNPELLEV